MKTSKVVGGPSFDFLHTGALLSVKHTVPPFFTPRELQPLMARLVAGNRLGVAL